MRNGRLFQPPPKPTGAIIEGFWCPHASQLPLARLMIDVALLYGETMGKPPYSPTRYELYNDLLYIYYRPDVECIVSTYEQTAKGRVPVRLAHLQPICSTFYVKPEDSRWLALHLLRYAFTTTSYTQEGGQGRDYHN